MLKLSRETIGPATPVVIMGAGGFVGRATVARLQGHGNSCIALTRQEIDLLAPGAAGSLAARLAPEATLVVVSAQAPVKNPAMLLANLQMMQAVVEAVKSRPIAHLVYVSSDAVYADSREPLTETSPTRPESLHGLMHLGREMILRTELGGIPQVYIRPTLIYGPGDPHNGYGPNRFMRLARSGQQIVLFGEGEERRDHVFIDDVAEIVRRCVLHRATGIINAVSGTVTPFRSVAEMAADRFEPRVEIVCSPRQGSMPHGGYRAFEGGALPSFFPGFSPMPLSTGLDRIRDQP